MRIVYVVDVHGRTDLVADVVAGTGPIDLLLVGGDITTGGTPADAKRAIHEWLPLTPRRLAVAGNMDSVEICNPTSSSAGTSTKRAQPDHIGASETVNPGPLMHGYYAVVDLDGDLRVMACRLESV